MLNFKSYPKMHFNFPNCYPTLNFRCRLHKVCRFLAFGMIFTTTTTLDLMSLKNLMLEATERLRATFLCNIPTRKGTDPVRGKEPGSVKHFLIDIKLNF